jgi:hypothetical protein
MSHLFSLIKNSIDNSYQANELVSRNYREQLDLRLFEDKINGALMFVFGEDLEHVHVGPGFYAYKLNGRLATRKEKARLGRLIVRRIPELIPAIKSYPLSEPELLRPCRKLFQSVKAKKRLTEIQALIAALFR